MTKGIYLLLISVDVDLNIDIGALGSVNFKKGMYVYVGSAQNSLEKRIARHFRENKRKFWHIDHLLSNYAVKPLKAFFKETVKQEECQIAKKISKTGIPIKGFGSRDCRCKSHLFKVENLSFLRDLDMKQFTSEWK